VAERVAAVAEKAAAERVVVAENVAPTGPLRRGTRQAGTATTTRPGAGSSASDRVGPAARKWAFGLTLDRMALARQMGFYGESLA